MNGSRWPFRVFILLLVVSHFVLHLTLGVGAAAPDLLTLAVLVAARELRGGSAAVLGLALGLLADSLSVMSFGAASVTLTILGYLGARSRDLFVGESVAFVGLYLFAGRWLRDVLYVLVGGATRRGEVVGFLLLDAPLAAAYMALVGLGLLIAYRMAARTGLRNA